MPKDPKVSFTHTSGVTYRMTPDGYMAAHNITAKRHKVERYLHRQVWADHYGAVPSAHIVRHKDRDRANNTISNLELVKATDQLLSQGDKIRGLAKEWHRSKAGRAQHREQAQKQTQHHTDLTVAKECEYCLKEYWTSKISSTTRKFCSKACEVASRKERGADGGLVACPSCGVERPVRDRHRAKGRLCRKCTQNKHTVPATK